MHTQLRRGSASSLTPEGQESLLEQAREVDLAAAVFRNRVINPDQYDDDEQVQVNARATTIPARTKRRWRQWYREAENQYGSGLIGLLPQFRSLLGENERLIPRSSQLIQQVLETHYDTVTRKPKRGAYGEYLKLAEEQHLSRFASERFTEKIERHKTAYDQAVAREGTRAAYPFKDYVHEQEKTISRHGSYAWAMATPGSYGIKSGSVRLQNWPTPGKMLVDTAHSLPSQAHCRLLLDLRSPQLSFLSGGSSVVCQALRAPANSDHGRWWPRVCQRVL